MSRAFNGVKVFSATMLHDRATLGEKVTEWLAQRPTFVVVEMLVTQSSDQAFHCIAITVFYRDPAYVARTIPPISRVDPDDDWQAKQIERDRRLGEEIATAVCQHPEHRLGMQGGLRRNQRVCLNCGSIVTVGKRAS